MVYSLYFIYSKVYSELLLRMRILSSSRWYVQYNTHTWNELEITNYVVQIFVTKNKVRGGIFDLTIFY